MSRKIELTQEQTIECLRLYNEELMGSPAISEQMGFHKTIIIRTLKDNGVVIGPSGRRNIGGRAIAQKRYESKSNNKEKRKLFYKEWSKENKELIKENHTKWREENREHVNKYAREYEARRCANDPKYKLSKRTRTAVYTCLKEANVAKYRKTFELLGYTIDELMKHLEALFTTGMTWDNYGEWHVDHKIPMSSFLFESTEDLEFKECWKLSNLQPLWGPDNLSKGTKLL
jgi:hypothetical protein